MTRLLPRSLFGQTVLILLAGLIVSHAVGSLIYTADREQAVRAVGGFATAQRIANLTHLVQDTPRESRQRIVAALSDQSFRVSLSAQPLAEPAVDGDDTSAARAIKDFLVEQLSLGSERQPQVWASSTGAASFGPGHMMGHGPFMRGFSGFVGFRDLQVSIPLADGAWLSFATALPAGGPAFSGQFLLSMGVMAIIILGVSVWAVRRVSAPLASLATAAERLGRNVNAPRLPETGTTETRQAARAFNDMQTRLRGLIENRTRLLAAISHDLRTPLTLLRLRTETVENAQERDKMLSTIAEMESMIGATLQFARDDSAEEPRRPTDLASLMQSVVDEMSDAGLPVRMSPAEPIVYECQPAALKRALRNLLDNAVKYGKSGAAEIRRVSSGIEIDVDDDGPGVPEAELVRVLEPFYRLEASRSRDTGGVGLGLAIAQSIVQAHGGALDSQQSAGRRVASYNCASSLGEFSTVVMRKLAWLVLLASSLALGRPASAETIEFGPDLSRSGWVVVSFPRIPAASFTAIDRVTLDVSTASAAGLLWRPVGDALRQARLASWRWTVIEGVSPTDLTKRGVDDRALGVYFMFGKAADATKSPMALLGSSTVTALVYVFGGDKPRGSVLPSPHMGARGKFIVLRPADSRMDIWFEEAVDFAKDYARAFGTEPPLLLAVAISSDSDDTQQRNHAKLRDLTINE